MPRSSQKGQYRLVTEILIFGIGIAIVSYIIVNFNSVESTISNTAMKSHLRGASNLVMLGITKASLNANSTVRITIPSKLSDNTYLIGFRGDSEGKCRPGTECLMGLSSYMGDINFSQKIFNMNQTYIISGWSVSSANYIDITANDTNIELKRTRLG